MFYGRGDKKVMGMSLIFNIPDYDRYLEILNKKESIEKSNSEKIMMLKNNLKTRYKSLVLDFQNQLVGIAKEPEAIEFEGVLEALAQLSINCFVKKGIGMDLKLIGKPEYDDPRLETLIEETCYSLKGKFFTSDKSLVLDIMAGNKYLKYLNQKIENEEVNPIAWSVDNAGLDGWMLNNVNSWFNRFRTNIFSIEIIEKLLKDIDTVFSLVAEEPILCFKEDEPMFRKISEYFPLNPINKEKDLYTIDKYDRYFFRSLEILKIDLEEFLSKSDRNPKLFYRVGICNNQRVYLDTPIPGVPLLLDGGAALL